MKIPFTKMHGTGNDFILIDEFKRVLIPKDKKGKFVKRISDRHFGIGSDGVIFIQKSGKADVKFLFYNPDGSEGEICGNGIRCFAKYVYERGIVRNRSIRVETGAGIVIPRLLLSSGKVNEVRVDMGMPRLRRRDIPVSGNPNSLLIDEDVSINGDSFRITAIGMGNPHAILFVEDVERVDVIGIGRKIRLHTALFPNGTNVHFVENVGKNEFKIRSYERGVENETLACGTGICASAVAAFINGIVTSKKGILFHARGGDINIDLDIEDGDISRVFLTGPAEEVFIGKITLNQPF